MIPTSIDGTDITGATIDGTDVQEITVDGDVVFSAVSIPQNAIFDDWADNKLTNRDNFSTTPYQFSPLPGGTTNGRPEWQYQAVDSGGTLQATNQTMEVEYGGGSPVTFVSADTTFDGSNGGTWYTEMEVDSVASPAAFNWNFMLSDPTQRFGGDVIRMAIDWDDDEVELTVFGSTIIFGSFSFLANTIYEFKVTRSSNGDWEIFVDDNSFGTATDTRLPDMSNGGIQYTWGNENRLVKIHRLEVF